MNTLAFVLCLAGLLLTTGFLGGLLAWAVILCRRICVGEALSLFEARINEGFIAFVAALILFALSLYTYDMGVESAKAYLWYLNQM